MKKEEAAIVSAYTGILIGKLEDFYNYVDKIMERTVFVNEYPKLMEEIKQKSRQDFLNIKVED